MRNDYLRGLIVALVATVGTVVLGRFFSRWLPSSVNGKTGAELLRENAGIVRLANGSFLLGLGIGLAMYKLMQFPANDLRPLGVAMGVALLSPMAVLRVSAVYLRKNPAEVVAAYALYQRLPTGVLYVLTSLGALALGVTFVVFRSW